MYRSVHDASQPYPAGEQPEWSHVIEGGGTMWEGSASEGGLRGQILLRASAVSIKGGQQYSFGVGVQVGDTYQGFYNVYNYEIDTYLNMNIDPIAGHPFYVNPVCIKFDDITPGPQGQLGDAGGKISVVGYCGSNTTGPHFAWTGTPALGTIGDGMLIGNTNPPGFSMDALMFGRQFADDPAAQAGGVQIGERYFSTLLSSVTLRRV